MNRTATPRRTTDLRASALDRTVAMTLAATEYQRFAAALERLEASHWRAPTDCPEWDVQALAGHTLGMAEMAASVRENIRQSRAVASAGGHIDALTALQVREHAHLPEGELVRRFRAIGPKAARGRRRTPGFLRRRKFGTPQRVNGVDEWWTIGYLVDTILTRDPWMHRIDLSRAAQQPMHLTPDHDGVLVADVVAEWAGRHREPFVLRLTGTAGGSWTQGVGGPEFELDAIEFCRALSGRQAGEGLLAVQVPF